MSDWSDLIANLGQAMPVEEWQIEQARGKTDMSNQPVSKNVRAAEVMGLRKGGPNVVVLDQPCELGYHCPVCTYRMTVKGNYDERLHWSEYFGFIWCEVCNKDYPSCLCIPKDIDLAIATYLDTVELVLRQKGLA